MKITLQELYDTHRFEDKLIIPAVKKLNASSSPHKLKMKAAKVRLHSKLPKTDVWTYEGTFPGPTLEVQSGDKISVEWKNEISGKMPLVAIRSGDNTQNEAGRSGRDPILGIDQLPAWTVVHLHGGRTEADSDGWTENSFFNGQTDSFNYENEMRATMLWYHDHAMHITRLNVYAGLAGMYIIRDQEEANLNLPSGNHEIPLMIQDRNLDIHEDGTLNGQLLHKVEDGVMEFFGPLNLVNGVIMPHHDVDARQYRVRVLNGSNARTYRLMLLDENKNPVNHIIKQIGTDGGLLGAPCPIPTEGLVLAPAERADLIIDFRTFKGKHLWLTNTATAPFDNSPLPTGTQPGEPLEDDSLRLKFPDVMQFRISGANVTDSFVLPTTLAASFVRTTHTSIPANHEHRLIALVEKDLPGGTTPLLTLRELFPVDLEGSDLITVIDNRGTRTNYETRAVEFEDTVNFMCEFGGTEVWKILNATEDTHPFHVHLVQFQALTRDDYQAQNKIDPMTGGTINPIIFNEHLNLDENEKGWKDTIRINPGEVVSIAIKFEGFTGRYMYHCHILEHEDHDMMRPFLVQPAEVIAMMEHSGHGGGHHH